MRKFMSRQVLMNDILPDTDIAEWQGRRPRRPECRLVFP